MSHMQTNQEKHLSCIAVTCNRPLWILITQENSFMGHHTTNSSLPLHVFSHRFNTTYLVTYKLPYIKIIEQDLLFLYMSNGNLKTESISNANFDIINQLDQLFRPGKATSN